MPTQHRVGGMTFVQHSTCPQCQGRQFLAHRQCPHCQGRGVVLHSQALELEVPAGAAEGHLLRVPGMADERPGARAGDLVVALRSQRHPVFSRHGEADLNATLRISLLEALVGFRHSLQLLDNTPLPVASQQVTPHGSTLSVPKGFPTPHGGVGLLHIHFSVQFPASLPASTKQRLVGLLADVEYEELGT